MTVNQMQRDFVGSPVQQDYSKILGTPFKVLLSNGVSVTSNEITKKTITEITDLPGLIAAIVCVRALHPRKLSGDDLKYIRSALGLRSNEVAKSLDMSSEHYSRCETGAKTLSSSAEKLYRMFVFLQAACKNKELQDKLAQSRKSADKPAKDENPEKAKKAIAAFRKIFFEMKIENIYPVGEEIGFSFSRRESPDECCADDGDGDGKWLSEADRDAA